MIIPNSTNGYLVTSIGDSVFAYWGSVTSVTIPDTITNIGSSAFSECSSLTKATMGNSVIAIGSRAFYDCRRLTSVAFPNSVTSIGDWAFWDCGMTNVTIPSSVTNIGIAAFSLCRSLTTIAVDSLNSRYSTSDGDLCDKSQRTLVEFPSGRVGSYAVPNHFTNIGSYAFYGCNLTGVMIPSSVSSIGDYAFYNCPLIRGVFFQGNAPDVNPTAPVFYGSTFVYYLPETSGWSSVFGGVVAFLWNPTIQIPDASFGVRTNQFGFNVTGTTNIPIVVEACTNLTNPTWSPLRTNWLTGGSSYFSDPQWANYPRRFYRLRSP